MGRAVDSISCSPSPTDRGTRRAPGARPAAPSWWAGPRSASGCRPRRTARLAAPLGGRLPAELLEGDAEQPAGGLVVEDDPAALVDQEGRGREARQEVASQDQLQRPLVRVSPVFPRQRWPRSSDSSGASALGVAFGARVDRSHYGRVMRSGEAQVPGAARARPRSRRALPHGGRPERRASAPCRSPAAAATRPSSRARRPTPNPVKGAEPPPPPLHGAERPLEHPQRRLPDRHLPLRGAARRRRRGTRPCSRASARRSCSTRRGGSSPSASGSTVPYWPCSTPTPSRRWRRWRCRRERQPRATRSPTSPAAATSTSTTATARCSRPASATCSWSPSADAPGFQVVRDYDLSAAVAPERRDRLGAARLEGAATGSSPAAALVGTVDRAPRHRSRAATAGRGHLELLRGRRDGRRLHRLRPGAVPLRRRAGGGAPGRAGASPIPNSGVRKPGQSDAGSGTTPTLMGKGLGRDHRQRRSDERAGLPAAPSGRRRKRKRRVCHQAVFAAAPGPRTSR